MPRVVHFEMSAVEPERAVKFYQDVFGWEVQKWTGPQDYWLVQTGTADQLGINGGLMRRSDDKVGFPHVVNTLEVSSVDDYVAKITANGGQVVVPKMPIPGVGYLAYFKDTEGNVLGIMQADAAAH